jgi:hypothetical protein
VFRSPKATLIGGGGDVAGLLSGSNYFARPRRRPLAALRPVALALERGGTAVDADLAWALLAVHADRRRRRPVRGAA